MNDKRTVGKVWLGRVIRLAIPLVAIAAIIYWIRFQPVAVDRHFVQQGSVVSQVLGTGTLEARTRTNISAKISGRIEQILVDQGDQVAAGTLLVRLDDAELRQQVAIAVADVETKQVAIERLEADISRADAVMKRAVAHYDRMNALAKDNAISRDDLDKASESLAIAQSDMARANAALAEGRKALIVAQRNLDYRETKLLDAQIVAPFDGLVVRRDREPGDVVVPGSTILVLISTDLLWISAWVDETEMAKLKVDQSASVVFRSEPDLTLRGKVQRLGREADRETREFVVDVQVLDLPENWAVGQRAEVYIDVDRIDNAVRVPSRFIQRKGEQTGLFVDRAGKVAWQPVEMRLRGRQWVAIEHGINEGDTIILPADPRKPLRTGQRVAEP